MKRRHILAITLGLGVYASSVSAVTETLTLAIEAAPRSIDPRYAQDANSQYLENLTHCSLTDFNENGATVGDLAKEWKWLNETTLEVTLSDAKFSDGSPVTGEDVKATYEFFKREDVANPSPRMGAFLKLKGVTVKSKNVVHFNLEESDSSFVTNLVVGILPAKLAAGDMISDPKKIIGCGPFKIDASSMTQVDLVINPNFSLRAQPKTKRVAIKIVKDETTRLAKLRAGEVDIVQNLISRDALDTIAKKYPSLTIKKRPGLNTAYLGFNMRDKIVGNVKVRQAIAHAIDKEKIIKYILKGLAIPANTLITPNDPFYAKSTNAKTYDPKTAEKLLDEAGYKDPDGSGGKPRFELTYKTTMDTTRVALAKAIAADLRKIGIKVKVQPLEWGRFKADVEGGKVQMWSLKWVGFKDPDIFRYAFATESFPPNGGNRGWYSNKNLDNLMAAGKTQTDLKTRIDTYAKVQGIVSEELPYVFLWHEENYAVVNKKVQGYEVYADGRFASLAKAYKK